MVEWQGKDFELRITNRQCADGELNLANRCPVYVHRYEKEFEQVQDVFELQRNLNNAFAYDLVPSPSVIIAALKAARRVNDFPTAVRIFEGEIVPPYLCLKMYLETALPSCSIII